MVKLSEIKEKILGIFEAGILKDTTWEYGFKFDFNRPITKIAYATNLTPFTINKAAEQGAELLITHHDAWPFMKAQREHCYALLKQNKINHCFVHTPLDAAEFGTSHSLARELGAKNLKPSVPDDEHGSGLLYGVVAEITPQSFEEFVALCEKVLQTKVIHAFKNTDKAIKKICICTGGGNKTTYMDSAIDEGCDIYITGEYGMYMQHYAEFHKLNLIIGGHTRTEIIGVRNFVQEILKGLPIVATYEIEEPNY